MSAARTLRRDAPTPIPTPGSGTTPASRRARCPRRASSDMGLPLGVQLVGRPDSEDDAALAGRAARGERRGLDRRPPVPALAAARARGSPARHAERRAAADRAARARRAWASTPAARRSTRACTSGNARPFVVFALLRRFLEHEGYEPTLVVNVTDVNDKIYDAAREQGVASEELARAMTAAYVEDTDRLGLGRPDHEPKASETIERDRGADRGPDRIGPRLRGGRRRLLQRRELPGLRQALEPPARGDAAGRGRRRRRAQASAAGLRALEGAPRRARTRRWSSPWGEGRPGLAHRVLRDGGGRSSGVDFEVHGGGSDLVFPHHENEIAQTEAARGTAARAGLDAQRHGRAWAPRRWPSPWATSGCCTGRSTSTGRDALLMWLVSAHYRKPIGFSEDALAQAEARRANAARAGPPARPGAARGRTGSTRSWSASSTRWRTTSTPPAARAVLFEWVREANRRLDAGERLGPGRLREMLHALGLERLLDGAADEAPDDGPGAGRRAGEAAAPRATSPRPTGCATSWPSAAGRSATPRTARGSCGPPGDRLRPQPGARGAARPARASSGSGPREQAAREPWLAGVEVRDGRRRTRSSELLRLARAPGHLRRGRGVPATRTPTPCSRPTTRSSLCLDEVQDPHNLGAVCRVAETAGCAGRRDPRAALRGGDRGRLQGVGRRGGAPRGGARAQPGRLARHGEGGGRLGLRRRRRTRPWPTTRPDYCGPRGARAGLRGARPAAARGRSPATSWCACRCAAGSGRSTCPPRPPRWCTRSCTCAKGLDRAP